MAPPRFNPFPGLRPFGPEERHLFFGRETQTAELLARLGRCRFLAAIGPSGSGKSSLVRAGLVPELHGGMLRGAGSHWQVAILRPGGDPLRHLAEALIAAGLFDADDPDQRFIVQALLERSQLGLVECVRRSRLPAGSNLVVVVDQFEEIFRFTRHAAGAPDTAAAFVNLLLEASRQTTTPIYIVLTMRSDFLGDCARHPGLAEAVNQSEYLIPRLTREQWKLAIEGPIRVGGGSVAPRLVQRLLNDVGDDPDQLPTLQHALMRTWDRWMAQGPPVRPIDLEDYESVGGMAEALSRHADEVFLGLASDAQRQLAERIFRALTEKSADARGTRRPTRVSELVAITAAAETEVLAVIEAFRGEGRTFLMPPGPLQADTVIDISHESLMRIWRRMRGWAEEEAQSARLYRRLAETARLWSEGRAALLRDPELEIALLWRDTNRPNRAWAERLSPAFSETMQLLDASQQAREAELAAQEAGRRRELEQARALADYERLRADVQTRAAQRLRWVAAGLLLLVVALAVGFWGIYNSRVARSRKLAVHATGMLTSDPELSLLLAAGAREAYPTPEADAVLREALFASNVRARLDLTNAIGQAAFSPDGAYYVATSLDGAVCVRRTGSTEAVFRTNTAHASGVRAVSFSPDSSHLVTAGNDAKARVWNLGTGQMAGEMTNHTKGVVSAVFSPQGDRVVTAGEDGRILLWHWRSVNGHSVVTLTNYPGRVSSVRCSPNGRLAAVATEKGQVDVWDLGETSLLWSLTGEHPQGASGLAFSPNGNWLVTSGRDGVARIWEMESGKMRAQTQSQAGGSARPQPLKDAHFSLDGNRLLTRGSSNVWVYDWVYDPATPTSPRLTKAPPLQFPDELSVAALSPDGEFVLTASATRAQVSNLKGESVAELLGHEGQVRSAVFSPDGRWILTGGQDGTARLWTKRTGTSILPAAPAGQFLCAARNGTTVLSEPSHPDQLLIRWTNRTQCALRAPFAVNGAALDARGRFLALASDGHDVALVDLEPRADSLELVGRDTNRVIWQRAQPAKVLRVALSDDGLALAVGASNGVVRWESHRGDWKAPLTAQRALATDSSFASLAQVGFGRDSRLLFAVTDGAVEVWDGTNSLGIIRQSVSREPKFTCAAFDPKGTLLAVGCSRGVSWVWRVARGQSPQPVDRQNAHKDQINDVDWSPDGQFLVTASGDRTTIVWSATGLDSGTGLSKIGVLKGPAYAGNDKLRLAAFQPDGYHVLTASYSGAVHLFNVEECEADMHRILKFAAQRATRALTEREQAMYLRR